MAQFLYMSENLARLVNDRSAKNQNRPIPIIGRSYRYNRLINRPIFGLKIDLFHVKMGCIFLCSKLPLVLTYKLLQFGDVSCSTGLVHVSSKYPAKDKKQRIKDQTGTFLAFLARTGNGFARHFSREMRREKLREKLTNFGQILSQF